MELSFDLYLAGLSYFANPMMFAYSFFGVLVGIVFGALPGLTATMTIAVFIPFTFGVPAVQSFAFLLGLYSGAVYGGSVSAILINIPGTPSAIATGFDGYPMCQQGRAGEAIGISTIASGLGGFFSVIVLAFAAPLIAGIALEFSAEEYVGITLIGLSIIAIISPGSTVKGLMAGTLGLIIGIVGLDPMGSYPRLVFNKPQLFDGVSEIPVMIGMYGLSEMFIQISDQQHVKVVTQKIRNVLPSLRQVGSLLPTIIRSSVIGVAIGAVPAAGGSIASLVAYGQEKRFSRKSEELGTGIPEGIAAPEAANNASTGGALIPMMTLGIPGDPMTAVLMGGLIIQGLRPRAVALPAADAVRLVDIHQPSAVGRLHDGPRTPGGTVLLPAHQHTKTVSDAGDHALLPDRLVRDKQLDVRRWGADREWSCRLRLAEVRLSGCAGHSGSYPGAQCSRATCGGH
jgi:putative tricarboxylic transport membrane protein